MWIVEHCARYNRSQLYDPNDKAEEEWSPIKPLISAALHSDNKRTADAREILNGLTRAGSHVTQAPLLQIDEYCLR